MPLKTALNVRLHSVAPGLGQYTLSNFIRVESRRFKNEYRRKVEYYISVEN